MHLLIGFRESEFLYSLGPKGPFVKRAGVAVQLLQSGLSSAYGTNALCPRAGLVTFRVSQKDSSARNTADPSDAPTTLTYKGPGQKVLG